MTEDYIQNVSEQFDWETAEFNQTERDIPDTYDVEEQFFISAMEEMVRYLFERFRQLDGESIHDYVEPENVDNIYITQYSYEPTIVIVEFETLPDDWMMENAELREFYWHPNPALSNETTAAYFQPR